MKSDAAQSAIATLMEERGAEKTICPSEVARMLSYESGDWRSHMEEVHHAVDAMLSAGTISLSWKGKKLSRRRGPYRIARRQPVDIG